MRPPATRRAPQRRNRCSFRRSASPGSCIAKGFPPPIFSAVPAGGVSRQRARGTGSTPHFLFVLPKRLGPQACVGGQPPLSRRHLGRRQTGRGRSSSTQVTHRSFRRKRQNSLVPLRLLSPQNLRFCGGPIKGAYWQTGKAMTARPGFHLLSPKPERPLPFGPAPSASLGAIAVVGGRSNPFLQVSAKP